MTKPSNSQPFDHAAYRVQHDRGMAIARKFNDILNPHRIVAEPDLYNNSMAFSDETESQLETLKERFEAGGFTVIDQLKKRANPTITVENAINEPAVAIVEEMFRSKPVPPRPSASRNGQVVHRTRAR